MQVKWGKGTNKMPVSQRNKVVSVGKTSKKTKEQRQKVYTTIEEGLKEYKMIYIVQCSNERNSFLKQVRRCITDSVWVFGKSKMVHKVLTDNEMKIADYVKGNVGLLLTNMTKDEVEKALQFKSLDYARQGMVMTRDLVLENLNREEMQVPSSMLEQFRKLNVPCKLDKGVITLESPYVLCSNGKPITSEQCQVAKMLQMPLAEVFVEIIAYYDGKEVINVSDMVE